MKLAINGHEGAAEPDGFATPSVWRFYLFNYVLRLVFHPTCNIVKNNNRTLLQRLSGGKGNMGSGKDVLCLQERVRGVNGRLIFKYIDSCSGDPPAVQRIGQCLTVYHGAAGRVDENGAGFHF